MPLVCWRGPMWVREGKQVWCPPPTDPKAGRQTHGRIWEGPHKPKRPDCPSGGLQGVPSITTALGRWALRVGLPSSGPGVQPPGEAGEA